MRHISIVSFPFYLTHCRCSCAGRAGRDGNSADCVLIADLTKLPSLFPSKGRGAVETRHSLDSLIALHEYAISTSCCRADSLLKHFGERLLDGCKTCDVCTSSPQSAMLDVTVEAFDLLQTIGNTHKPKDRKFSAKGWYTLAQRLPSRHSGHWWRGLSRCLLQQGLLLEQGKMPTMRVVATVQPTVSSAGIALLASGANTTARIRVCQTADMVSVAPAWNGVKGGGKGRGKGGGKGRGKRKGKKKGGKKKAREPHAARKSLKAKKGGKGSKPSKKTPMRAK